MCHRAMHRLGHIDDFDDHFEPGPDDFDQDFEPGPDPFDEQAQGQRLIHPSDDAQDFASHFLEDWMQEMVLPEQEPASTECAFDDEIDVQHVFTSTENNHEVAFCSWDPYGVYEPTPSGDVFSTPSPNGKRALSPQPLQNTVGGASSFSTPVKRVKLTGKQSVNYPPRLPVQECINDSTSLEELSSIARSKTGVDKVRDLFMRVRRPELRARNRGTSSAALNTMIRKEWHDMPKDDKTKWLFQHLTSQHGVRFKFTPKAEYYKRQHEAALVEEDLEMKHDGKNMGRGIGGMGTWNGTWLDEEPEFQEFLERVEPSEVEEGILELQCFKALVARFEEFLVRRCETLGFQKWSYVFELSTKSEDKGRIHIHAY